MAQVAALCFAFIAGVIVGISACYLHFDQVAKSDKAEEVTGLANEALFICGIHHNALYKRAKLYRQEFRHWPTNVQDLVEAHFLPEFSQVHLCPSQITEGGLGSTSFDQESTFIEKNHRGAVGYYASSPYRFGFDGTNFTVICTFNHLHNKE